MEGQADVGGAARRMLSKHSPRLGLFRGSDFGDPTLEVRLQSQWKSIGVFIRGHLSLGWKRDSRYPSVKRVF
ncbi:hypothetical protein E2C01_067074 [Portunus trituberculatus]|uniref:Uncharacterized protein n=1 Tax=Portunus trituberculatus TaxID=210409 RepID=A0A5B7HIV1_PORTR|nr:hypothetical protein [Portunus trituberculatus]